MNPALEGFKFALHGDGSKMGKPGAASELAETSLKLAGHGKDDVNKAGDDAGKKGHDPRVDGGAKLAGSHDTMVNEAGEHAGKAFDAARGGCWEDCFGHMANAFTSLARAHQAQKVNAAGKSGA